MIEATCAACGTVNRMPEADVPSGAQFVSCSSCRARVALPQKARAATSPGAGALDLADLPAPRRASALGGVAAGPGPRPVPKSGLAAASAGTIDFDPVGSGDDDLLGPPGLTLADEPSPPAPKSAAMQAQRIPTAALDFGPELPAPRRSKPVTDGIDLGIDLPKPASNPATARDLSELPAPKAPPPRMATGPVPTAPRMPSGALPTMGRPTVPALPPLRPPMVPPSRSTGPIGFVDLPATKAVPSAELPAPKGPATSDLPTPKAGGLPELPTPKAGGVADLPTPKGGAPGIEDVVAPKGFFDDLPQPARPVAKPASPAAPPVASPAGSSRPELPTPKPGPGIEDVPAPKGFFDDLPQPSKSSKPEVPAPKGFFDDLPGKVPNRSDVPAPKGFFDDLPGKVPNRSDVPAPKGFFDDLPQPSKSGAPEVPGRKPAELPAQKAAFPALELDLGDAGSDAPPLELDLGTPPADADPGIELALPTAAAAPAKGQFDDLDLSKPTAMSMRMEAAQAKAPRTGDAAASELPPVNFGKPLDALELEEPRGPTTQLAPKRTKDDKAAQSSQDAQGARFHDPAAKQRRAKRTKLVAFAAAGLLALGTGGFVLYRRHAAEAERTATVESSIATARSSLVAADPKHWTRAAAAAQQARALEPTNPAALGLLAEAQFAAALVDGVAGPAKIADASGAIAAARNAALTGPELLRAQALQAVAENRPAIAIPKLTALAKAAPKDARLALYLGWAHALAGSGDTAIAAFDQAAADKSTEVPALYGRAGVKLAAGDTAGARADFAAVLAVAKDHVGAQVGLASALPASQSQQQESDLLAILQRKDLKTADPRAVTAAWVLAGDAAARGGRLDAARERYRSALKVTQNHVAALTGLAAVELRDGKLDTATETIVKAVAQQKDDLGAQLVAAEIESAQKSFAKAHERLKLLADRDPPLPKRERARLFLVQGRVFEAQGEDLKAVDAYEQSATLMGDADLTPTLAAVTKLSKLAVGAAPADAEKLRARAAELLRALSTAAEADPALALTLGAAYVEAGDPAKAEPWLRRAVAGLPQSLEAQYQLARALQRLAKTAEALAILTKIFDTDPTRTEIGLELARTYEAAENDAAAGALYDRLIAANEPSVELRARAGRFWARTGATARAAEQGAAILKVDPEHAAGMYLKGEGLLAADKPDDARKLFTRAIAADKDAQYYDAQGRASEALAKATLDTSHEDVAIRAYTEATALAPKMFNPLVGLGRLYVKRGEAKKASGPLLAANKLRGDDWEVPFLLGQASQLIRELDTAIQWFEYSRARKATATTAYELGKLYNDRNKGAQAAVAFEEATRLGAAEEKAGVTHEWLTDAYYFLGETTRTLGRDAEAARAWLIYVRRDDVKPGARLTEVKNALATTLQRFTR